MLTVPELPADVDTLGAAFAYAKAGWYVLPIKRGTKHPGSVLGKAWQQQSSRDPEQLAAWWAGTDHGIALHVGRSGAIVADVDYPERLPAALAGALFGDRQPPFQATRFGTGARGHYLFAVPEGRSLGNGVGRLGGAWGDMRGLNGVIVVAPSAHPEDDGCYVWRRPGPVPTLPADVAAMLDDAAPGEDAATDAEVTAFMQQHGGGARIELLPGWVTTFEQKVAAGESRHARMASVVAGAMKEAAAGYFDAMAAAEALRAAFLRAVGNPPRSARQGDPRSGSRAVSEWQGLLAWGVGQARAANVDETRARIEERMPADDLTFEPGAAATSSTPRGEASPKGRLRLTAASEIGMRAVRWLWQHDGQRWVPLGELTLLGGREGIGKSTIAYEMAAHITRGTLPGVYEGEPRAVVIYATEDDWGATIVPRLAAHGADLTKAYRLDVEQLDGGSDEPISLPRDTEALAQIAHEHEVGLILLDPLMSIVGKVDTHKDAEVRKALEPVVRIAHNARAAVLALIHVNKSQGVDALTRLMGSRAFAAVARAVLYAVAFEDPEGGPDRTILGQAKSNLGPKVPGSREYRVLEVEVGRDPTDGTPITTGRIEWLADVDMTVGDVLSGEGDAEVLTAVDEAADWLHDHLQSVGGTDESASIKRGGAAAGHSDSALKRARRKLRVQSTSHGFPRQTFWSLPGTQPAEALEMDKSA